MHSKQSNTTSVLSHWKDQEAFVSDNPQFLKSQISYLMRQRFLNGLMQAGAVKKLGRKLYIHEGRFAEWLEQLTSDNSAQTPNLR